MRYHVKIHYNGKLIQKHAEAGTNLLQFLLANSIDINSPCGGKGTCGKCMVKVKGEMDPPSNTEKKLLGPALAGGIRLACQSFINSDIEIYIEEKNGDAQISTDGNEFSMPLDPIVKKKVIKLEKPDLQDQRPDLERILSCTGGMKNKLSVTRIREIPGILRENDFTVTIVHTGNELLDIEAGDTSRSCYGLAVDIGTTTIAAYLYNLVTGKRVDVCSMLNPQRKFGADVISRIEYASTSPKAAEEMNSAIVSCINSIISAFLERNAISASSIYSIVFVGNTTMLHFLLNLPAANLAVSPFIPVTTGSLCFRGEETGFNINKNGIVVLFPGVSAYVGADTVAAVLSSGMYKEDVITLLVDIGTNGEIVLGNREWMYACSTAAGPAFEGANIRNGVGGIRGAIDKVIIGEDVEFTTIGNEQAIGLCGSGVVDAIAGLLSAGIIDETGRIIDKEEAEALPPGLKDKLVEIDGKNAFMILENGKCASNIDIAITQKDVRELQNAKAAIAAGIRTLIREAGIKASDIEKVYLAGGFGNYIDKANALLIGLLPSELEGKIESIGNAAGAGAIFGLLSLEQLKKAEKISNLIKYIELSACPEFMDEYVECMMFGD